MEMMLQIAETDQDNSNMDDNVAGIYRRGMNRATIMGKN
jgi:hypothetical protein